MKIILTCCFAAMLGCIHANALAQISLTQPFIAEPTVQTETISLREAFIRLENKYKVSILYDSKLIQQKVVELTRLEPATRNITAELDNILKNSGLSFDKVSKDFYVIIVSEARKSRSDEQSAKPDDTKKEAYPDQNNGSSAASDPSASAETTDPKNKNVTITGRVTDDAKGEGLPGVSVLLKGTTTGTVTDANGSFSLSVPDASANGTLIFSFIGYITQEVSLNGRTSVEVSMAPDIKALEEVVVVGYGTQKREDLTGAISSVKGSDISKLPVASVTQALQGQVPGVEITTNTGAPGSNLAVRIRGVNTVNNTEPLYVVDGMPIFGGLNQINPNDIESVDVLKDASAGAIYGARAANGVVIITTKKGKEGPLKVSFNAYYGSQTPWKKLDLLNATQYRTLLTEAHTNAGTTPPPALTNPARAGINTDWQDLMLTSAPIQSYNLSLSGGGKFATFNISGGYFRQDGILNNTRYDRANIQINSQGSKGRFKFGESILVAGDINKPEATFVGGTMFSHMINASPLVAPTNINNLGGFGGAILAEDNAQFLNPYGYSSLYDANNKGLQVLGNVYGQFEITKGLEYRLNLGTDLAAGQQYTFVPTYNMGVSSNNIATLSNSNSSRISWLAEHTLTYRKALGKHDITALAGYSDQYLLNNGFNAYGENFPSNEVRVLDAAGRVNKNNGGSRNELHLRSFFARVNYAFANKYLLTATLRRDGSSNFSADNRFGNFPSVSLGWVLSEEGFLKNVPAISFLKIRASYGLLGNQDIGAYNDEAVLNQSSNYVLGTNQEIVTGIIPRRLPSDAKWETTKQADIGLELGLFQDRIMLVADYFSKQTEDMLIAATNIPFTTGLPDVPFINAGGISNRGVELALTYKNTVGGFNYSVTGNFTTYQNEVTSLGNGGKPIFSANSYTKTEVGSSIGRFFGYVVEGIYQSEAEIDRTFAPKAAPGDLRFKDVNKDGKLDDLDREYIGSPLPDFTYGLNANMGYKGIDFSFLFYGTHGNDIINTLIPGMNSNVNTTTLALDGWKPTNTDTDVPRAIIGDPNNNLRYSSRYIESGSFLRLRNVTLGYTLPSAIVQKMRIGSLRVYVSAQNLLTITEYSGLDPETANGSHATQFAFGGANNSANLLRGLDRGTYPLARTILGGVQIDF